MNHNNLMRCLISNDTNDRGFNVLKDIFLLAIRIYVAWIFLNSGLIKLDNWSQTLELFRSEYHVPLLPPVLAAYVGTAGELIFPCLIIAGLFTRWAALGLFVVNAMAVISYPQLLDFECPAAINDHKYWAILMSALFIFGAGRWSLDYFLGRKNVSKNGYQSF